MIIDTTLFYNEFDMLDIHLAISSDYVDRWIILEASRTFSGIEKPYYLSENLDRYQRLWGDRIEVVRLPVEPHETNLICETKMRQGLAQSLACCDPQDIVIHGDLDEIIDPGAWSDIVLALVTQARPVSCGMEMYFYRLDQRAQRQWRGSVVAKKHMFHTPHDLYKGQSIKRKDRSHCVSLDRTVGWHWTWMGDDQAIREKVVACIEHQNRDPEQVLAAFQNLDTQTAINHKCESHVVTTHYPPAVLKVLREYPRLWHHSPQ
jgi:hypothetical protein